MEAITVLQFKSHGVTCLLHKEDLSWLKNELDRMLKSGLDVYIGTLKEKYAILYRDLCTNIDVCKGVANLEKDIKLFHNQQKKHRGVIKLLCVRNSDFDKKGCDNKIISKGYNVEAYTDTGLLIKTTKVGLSEKQLSKYISGKIGMFSTRER